MKQLLNIQIHAKYETKLIHNKIFIEYRNANKIILAYTAQRSLADF